MKVTRSLVQRGNHHVEIVERVEEPRRMCYDLWQRCIGCPDALGCRDCRYQELEIRKYYPLWYAQLQYYKKIRKPKIEGKSAGTVIIDEFATKEGGDTSD